MKRKEKAMNKTIFKQLDSRWSSLPYPTKKSSFGGNGCGCCACLHNMIELEEYKDWTPKNLRPYMVNQGFAIAGKGTLWSGISKTLQHYGFKVINHPTLQNIFATLDERKKKGLPCIGVILFSSGSRGGITWTAGGHFVAFTDYKVVNGKHYFYTKDSGGRNHDGFYCYETQMKGLIPQIWSAISTAKAATLPTLQAAVETLNKLTVDGEGGEKTVIATQRFFKTFEDGIISGQNKSLKKYYPALTAVMFASNSKSTVVKELQSWLGVTRDGVIGQETTKAWQRKLRDLGYLAKDETIDGIFGPKSMKAWQRFLNDQLYKEEEKTPEPTLEPTPEPTPTPTPTKTVDELAQEVIDGKWGSGSDRKEKLTKAGYDYDAVQNKVNEILKAKEDPLQPWYDALKEQYEWSKNQKYKFSRHPNVTNSKTEGTCITFVAVALQRLGLLPKGKWFWLYPKTKKMNGNADKYVKKHPEIFEVFYPWKTIAELWEEGRIKKGDIIGFDKPDHTMVFKGFNKNGEPIFDTMGHKRGLNVTYPSYAKRKVGMIVRLKKVVK